jgi:hypothetical protein
MWYIAHVIEYIKLKHETQAFYPVYENMVLISAPHADGAREAALIKYRRGEGDDNGTLTWNGKPAALIVGGVRKIVACEDPGDPPVSGDELTYNEIMVTDEQTLHRLIIGDEVQVILDEIRNEPGTGEENDTGTGDNAINLSLFPLVFQQFS